MMNTVANKQKNKPIVSITLLAIAMGLLIAFFTIDMVRFAVYDAYNSVFKVVITDRVLRDEAQVYSNLPYCETDNPRQTLDIYVPQVTSERPMKLVIFIHGGGWRAGDKSSSLMTYHSEAFLKNGIAVASLNYRLYPEVTYPEPNEDIACALRYLKAEAHNYDISTNKWTLFGDSAGAQLGAYAMSDPTVSQPVKLFVGFYGPYSLVDQINRQPNRDNEAWNYTNKGKSARDASPLFRDMKKDATYMLFHGSKDRVVNISQSQNFYDKLTSNQINSIFTPVNNAGHYFSPRSKPTASNIKQSILRSIRTLN
jgi:acetyl esterase/lipase